MGRILRIVLFTFAAVATVAAGDGVVVAAHVDPPDTPLFHTHPFTAYRLAIFDQEHTRYHASEVLTARTDLFEIASVVVLALLVSRSPGIHRPTLRAVARLQSAGVIPPQWRTADPLGPPRSSAI